MHIPGVPGSEPLHRSLSELEPFARVCGVRIAVENGVFAAISDVLSNFSPESVGLCYDSGHGNMSGEGLDRLEENTDRLCVLHLHDNDSKNDQHQVPFMGTIDWERVAGIVAKSAYAKPVQMEVTMKQSGIEDEVAFLEKAYEVGMRIDAMVEAAKG
jgi:sugar phosphate isomerase/epimerase